MMEVTVTMPANDVEILLSEPPLKGVKPDPFPRAWFEPKPTKMRFFSVQLPNAKYLEVVVDDASVGDKTVHMRWFET